MRRTAQGADASKLSRKDEIICLGLCVCKQNKHPVRLMPSLGSKMQNMYDEFKVLLERGGEREAHDFLKNHKDIIIKSFNVAWNYYTCISEFQLANNFRADFLILSAHSGYWHAIFVELEPVDTKLYNKDGTQSRRLRGAMKQIEDWKEWIRINEPFLRQEFAKILKRDNAPAIWPYPIADYKKGYSSGAKEIADMSSNVHYYYHIVIGRRNKLSEEEQKRRAANDLQWGGPQIATYDRLLETTKRIAREDLNKIG